MKIKPVTFLICSLLLFTNCNKEKTFTIKGRLLISCDRPIPVIDHGIRIEGKGITSPIAYTNDKGHFAITYEHSRRTEYIYLTVKGEYGVGLSQRLIGIPMRKDVEVGDVYLTDNFFSVIKLAVQRPTDLTDTIYYDHNVHLGYRKFKVGPFLDGEIIDSFTFASSRIFDTLARDISSGTLSYDCQINQTKKRATGDQKFKEECKRYNVAVLEVD